MCCCCVISCIKYCPALLLQSEQTSVTVGSLRLLVVCGVLASLKVLLHWPKLNHRWAAAAHYRLALPSMIRRSALQCCF